MQDPYLDENYDVEDKAWDYSPQEGWSNYFLFPLKDIEHSQPYDSGVVTVQENPIPEAKLDNFDGVLTDDRMLHQVIRDDERNNPISSDDINFAENYTYMYHSGRRKLAHIERNDYVLIMRPHLYGLDTTPRSRFAKVIDNVGNGWIVVKNADSKQLAVYCGDTDEDNDVQKLDFDFLAPKFKKAGKKRRAEKVLRMFFIPDEGKEMDLEQNISEEP